MFRAWEIVISKFDDYDIDKFKSLLYTCRELYKIVNKSLIWKEFSKYKTFNSYTMLLIDSIERGEEIGYLGFKKIINYSLHINDWTYFNCAVVDSYEIDHIFASYKYKGEYGPEIPKSPIYPSTSAHNYKIYIEKITQYFKNSPEIQDILSDHIKFIGIKHDDLDLFVDDKLKKFKKAHKILLKELKTYKPINIINAIIGSSKYPEEFRLNVENILVTSKKSSIAMTEKYKDKIKSLTAVIDKLNKIE